MIAYLLIGEAWSVPRAGLAGARSTSRPLPPADEASARSSRPAAWCAIAHARSVNGLGSTGGNAARLARDSNAAIDEMVADIDAAQRHVHACFYIWLTAPWPEGQGRLHPGGPARRGGSGIADALGSRHFIASEHWHEMGERLRDAREALPARNPLWTLIRGRVDLRNHRKQLVVDNRIAWCGSQNAADPEFRSSPNSRLGSTS